VIRQSTTEERARATGRESPANPPIAAPIPVGTIITLVYSLLHCSHPHTKTSNKLILVYLHEVVEEEERIRE
jgi:hypothetical protein